MLPLHRRKTPNPQDTKKITFRINILDVFKPPSQVDRLRPAERNKKRSSFEVFYLREWLRFEGHRTAAGSYLSVRHRYVLEARRDFIARGDRVGDDVIVFAVTTLSRLVLLGEHRSCDQGLLWCCLFLQSLLLVHLIDVIRLGYQAIVLIMFHDHAPFSNRNKDFYVKVRL